MLGRGCAYAPLINTACVCNSVPPSNKRHTLPPRLPPIPPPLPPPCPDLFMISLFHLLLTFKFVLVKYRTIWLNQKGKAFSLFQQKTYVITEQQHTHTTTPSTVITCKKKKTFLRVVFSPSRQRKKWGGNEWEAAATSSPPPQQRATLTPCSLHWESKPLISKWGIQGEKTFRCFNKECVDSPACGD